jgi:hypothetical protein
MRILCLDPGTTNYGLSILNVNGRKLRIEGSKTVINLVKNMKDPLEQYQAYKAELKALGQFDLVVAERFQARGNKGPTIECISLMLGALLEMYPGKTIFLTASTWKNRVNRVFDLKELYEELKQEQVDVRPISNRKTVHELDSSLMGMYAYYREMKLDYYSGFASEESREWYLQMFLNSTKL